MSARAAASEPSEFFAFVRRRRDPAGVEVWLWKGSHGVNLSIRPDGPGYPASLELARAWAKRHAFRYGIVYAEPPKRKREPKPPELTPEQKERRRIAWLDGYAQENYRKDPARAAESWIRSAMAAEAFGRQHVLPGKAKRHATAVASRVANAITCLEQWKAALLAAPTPPRRLTLVPLTETPDPEGHP